MIENFKPGDEKEVSDLVIRVYEQFIAPDFSEKGRKTFLDYATPDVILERFKAGNIILCRKEEGRIVGMIEVRENSHISLFFIDPDYHNRGIGRQLLDEVISRLRGKTDFLTVHSSIYAEKIYEKFGFFRIGELEETDGILHIPMKLNL